MNEFNHQMLAIARESRGLTQKELVDKVPNLNQGNYSKMEKGLIGISDETFSNIAKALDYPLSFFYKKPVSTPISSFYYRKRVSMSKSDLSVLEAKLDIIRIIVDELLDSVEIPEFNIPQYAITDKLSPQEIAVKIREFLKLPRGPIQDIIKTLESAGIIIYFFDTDIEKFDGITLVTDKGQPIIFINNNVPNDRKIFNIAHELGHLITHIPFSPLPEDRDEETETNQFAGEFLLPYLDCRSDLSDLRYSRLGVLKSYWKVSKAAIIYRAKTINAITHERYTNLNIELSKNGEKRKESGFIEIEEPRLVNLIIDAHEGELGYSLDELIELLGISMKDYFEYFRNSKHKIAINPKRLVDLRAYSSKNKRL